MNVLGRHGVLRADLSDAMRMAVGFRNVLVHEYVEVSDEIVESRLSDRRDLEQFVEQVTAFLRDGTPVRGFAGTAGGIALRSTASQDVRGCVARGSEGAPALFVSLERR